VADEDYEREFNCLAEALAMGPTLSYGWIKKAMAASTLTELSAVQDIETRGQEILHATEDFRAGVRGFRARTRPDFRGR
jgi:enoyl-CoA hydratase/carnithine racemase